MKNDIKFLKKINEFPVGKPFSLKGFEGEIMYGWVIGYGISPAGEMIFKVKWARDGRESTVHPAYVNEVTHIYVDNEADDEPRR